MKLVKITSIISTIYFVVMLYFYNESEGRKAAFMGSLVSIMFFIISEIYNEKDNNNSGDMR